MLREVSVLLRGVDTVPESEKYDVIVFRGVIQYLLDPRKDLAKAAELLKDNGILFISGSNSESLCFRLFKGKFTQPVAPTDYYMFNRKILSDYF